MTFPTMVPRIRYAWWETMIMRGGFAWLLFEKFPTLGRLPPAGEELRFPNGLAKFFDLSWVLVESNYEILQAALLLLCVVYTLGVAFPVVSTALFVVYVLPPTLQNSHGSISHYYQLMVLLLLGQMLASWVWCIKNRRTSWKSLVMIPSDLHSFAVRVTLQVIAANYVLCGITKLLNSNFKWVWNSRYMPLQYEKIQMQQYYNRLEHQPMDLGAKLNAMCIEHPWLCLLFYAPGLIGELIALMILWGRAWALWIGLTMLAMHRIVEVTMGVRFHQHELMMLIFVMNVPFWIVFVGRAGAKRMGMIKPVPGEPLEVGSR